MENHYMAQDKFPMEITPHVKTLGNYFFNLFLVMGKNKSALFETDISGVIDSVSAHQGPLLDAPQAIQTARGT